MVGEFVSPALVGLNVTGMLEGASVGETLGDKLGAGVGK